MQVAISGSSGLIGRALAASLTSSGHTVQRIARDEDNQLDVSGLAGVDAVVHLAGAGIGDHRWTESHKRAILESRTSGTGRLAQALAELDAPPKVLVSASAIGYYGDRGDEVLTEASSPGSGFLADLVKAWEGAAEPARAAGIRTVCARSGIVLSRHGGALPQMLRLFRLGLGGRLGSGQQWMSWISLDDEVGALRFVLDNEAIQGPVNLVSPAPVTNRDFTKALARAIHRPAVLPVPRFAPRLVLGREMADQLLFYSQRIEPGVLQDAGYAFAQTTVDRGLAAALAD